MTRRDYEDAARIVQKHSKLHIGGVAVEDYADREAHDLLVDAFVEFFKTSGANYDRFDEDRFRRACVPGANVRAR